MRGDAKVVVWVGVRYEDAPDDFYDEIEDEDGYSVQVPTCLPASVRAVLGSYPPSGPLVLEEGEEWYEGAWSPGKRATLEEPQVGEESAGLGMVVFEHDWDYGIIPFDLPAIQAAITRWLPVVEARLAEWGIALPVGSWCLTDYS